MIRGLSFAGGLPFVNLRQGLFPESWKQTNLFSYDTNDFGSILPVIGFTHRPKGRAMLQTRLYSSFQGTIGVFAPVRWLGYERYILLDLA